MVLKDSFFCRCAHVIFHSQVDSCNPLITYAPMPVFVRPIIINPSSSTHLPLDNLLWEELIDKLQVVWLRNWC
jgi:hypothetical protein